MTDALITTQLAAGGEFDPDDAPWTFHGTVVANDEVTHGQNGAKFWPAAELEKAAGQLAGKPIVDGHDYDENGQPPNDAVIGKVTRDAYDADVGWVYEMEVSDGDLARKLHYGHLEVSLHGGALETGGETEDGALIMKDVFAADLAVVPYGGARANSVSPGAAALSAGDIRAILNAATSDDPSRASTGGESGANNGSTTNMSESETFQSETATAQANRDAEGDDEDVESDGTHTTIERSRYETLLRIESNYQDLKDENEDLRAKLGAQETEIAEVKELYMQPLMEECNLSRGVFEGLSVPELREEHERRLGLEEGEGPAAAIAYQQAQAQPQTASMNESNTGFKANLGGSSVTDSIRREKEAKAELADLREKQEKAAELGYGADAYGDQIEDLEAELGVN